MADNDSDWERRVAECWAKSAEVPTTALLETIDRLAAERPAHDAAALFERASARDTAGLEAEAEPLYRAALSSGTLDPLRRTRATIQLASTLRLLGRLDESEQLLRAELIETEAAGDAHPLRDETRAFLALTLLAKGEATEAAALALTTLAPHLSRYTRAVRSNAEELSTRHRA